MIINNEMPSLGSVARLFGGAVMDEVLTDRVGLVVIDGRKVADGDAADFFEVVTKLLPGCFSARSILAKKSSFVINVESSFSATSFRRYLATRLSMPSSSASVPKLRSISAFNCAAVITSIIFFIAKLNIIYEYTNKNKIK